jgi:hypothetical protein
MTGHDGQSVMRFWLGGLVVLVTALIMPSDALRSDEMNLETLSATRTRPLFSSTRHPPPPPKERARPAPAATPSPQPPDVVLSAVVIGSDVRVAFLKRGKETRTFPVRSDSNVDGWTVTAIEPRHVVIENGAQRSTIGFPKRTAGTSTVSTAAAKPASGPP